MPFPFSNRRTLHNPFFPKYPSIAISPTQPPTPQPSPPILPKHPSSSSSSSSSSSQNLPFFPLYPSPPPPPFIPSVPTFPANISSITSTPSPRNPHSPSKLVPFLFIPILALAFIILVIAFFFLRGKRSPVKKTTETPPDFHRLVQPNDRSSSKHSASSSAPHSSEFLYLGTLVNSHGHVPSAHVSREMDPTDSPELRPLPPLTRQTPPPPSTPPPPPPPPPAAVHKVLNFSRNSFGGCDQNGHSVCGNEKIFKKEEVKVPTADIFGDLMDDSDGAVSFEELRRPKLKPLHWDKVKASSDRSMAWDKMKSSSFQLNEEMIETLFGCDSEENINGRDNAWRKMNLNSTCVVLDPKKAQNIAILLKALHISKVEVCDALIEGNAHNLGGELLETLLRMAPSKEEEIKLREYSAESSQKLGPAESFLKAMLDIPFAFKRLEALRFISCFESEVHYIRKSFEVVQLACEELRGNRIFHKILDAVLKTGNRLNVGTNRGDAKAFKLDSLLKLIDVKSTDGITTLLHFVVQEISIAEGFRAIQSNSSTTELDSRKIGLNMVSSLGSELNNVKKAATMDSKMLGSYVTKLAIGIEKIQEVLRLNGSDKFKENMIRFLKTAEVEMTRLQDQEGFVLSLVKEITAYFHGNLTKEEAHPYRIFMVVRDFLVILDQVCKDVTRDSKGNVVAGFPKIHPVQNASSDDDSSSFSSMSS